ncbi:MAG: glycosyltransferase family 4 protein [Blastocatellia bacterium]|nr:glycosyltransferase family 4 protein [Blastocatellia bacterium]
MKIGYIAQQVHRHGGMERASAEVLERLANKHETVVMATKCEIRAAQLSWIQVPSLLRPEMFHLWNFRRKVRRTEPAQHCEVTMAVNNAATEADVIVAQFCHAAFTDRFGGLRGGAKRWRRGYQQLAQRVFMEQERASYLSPRLRKVIAVSEGVKRELMQYYGLPAERFAVIPNGVDHTVFKPAANAEAKRRLRAELQLPLDAFSCLFVGGDWDRKGLADAIHAVARVPDAVLVVVGRGDEARFGAIAAQAGAQDRIIFCGTSARPQDYYTVADVFVFPTRYEAFSLATLEAAAAGLPILAPRINGTEELIEDSVNGFFVEMNPASVYDKLRLLWEAPARLQEMSAAILQTSKRYTWDRIAAEQMQLVESIGGRG